MRERGIIFTGDSVPGIMAGTSDMRHGDRIASVFARLWDSLNAARGYGWDANPWVWAMTFRRVE